MIMLWVVGRERRGERGYELLPRGRVGHQRRAGLMLIVM